MCRKRRVNNGPRNMFLGDGPSMLDMEEINRLEERYDRIALSAPQPKSDVLDDNDGGNEPPIN